MDKRAPLRQFYSDQEKAKQEADRFNKQAEQAKSLEKVLFNSFQSLVSVLEGQGTKAETIALIVRALDDLDKQSSDNTTEVQMIKSGLETLEKQISEIPTDSLKKIPKFLQQREEVKVSNLTDLSDVLERVEAAVKSLELNVEAPKINLPAPQVKVDAPIVNVPETDLSPLVKTMREVVEAVKTIEYPSIPETNLTGLEKESKEHTKLLQKIVEKPVGGGGGGGGNGTPYTNEEGKASYVSLYNGKIPTKVFGQTISGTETTIATDGSGRVKISHGQPDSITAVLDAVGTQIAVPSDGFSDAIFYFDPAGSHVITFENSPNSTDGTDGQWFPSLASNQGANASSATTTGTITTTDSSWRVSAPAGTWIRARVSTRTTAGAINTWATTTTAAAQPQITATVNSAPTTAVTPSVATNAGGYTSRYLSASLTAKDAVKTGAGSIVRMAVYNPNTTPVWLQFFNTALASVTVGTTAPVETFMIPPGDGTTPGAYTEVLTNYDRFSNAITIAPWSVPDNSAGSAPATGLIVNIGYA